jgi:hypothetical protein
MVERERQHERSSGLGRFSISGTETELGSARGESRHGTKSTFPSPEANFLDPEEEKIRESFLSPQKITHDARSNWSSSI